MNISVEVEGVHELRKAFTKVENAADDLTPVWKDVQKEFFEIEKEQFQSGGAKGASGKWKDLSPAYEKIKTALYGTFALLSGVLRATHDLYKSLTRKTGDTVEIFEKQEAAFGTSLLRGKYHQEGGGRLPQRKVIDLSGSQKRRIGRVLTKHLQAHIKKHVRHSTLAVDETNFRDI